MWVLLGVKCTRSRMPWMVRFPWVRVDRVLTNDPHRVLIYDDLQKSLEPFRRRAFFIISAITGPNPMPSTIRALLTVDSPLGVWQLLLIGGSCGNTVKDPVSLGTRVPLHKALALGHWRYICTFCCRLESGGCISPKAPGGQ